MTANIELSRHTQKVTNHLLRPRKAQEPTKSDTQNGKYTGWLVAQRTFASSSWMWQRLRIPHKETQPLKTLFLPAESLIKMVIGHVALKRHSYPPAASHFALTIFKTLVYLGQHPTMRYMSTRISACAMELWTPTSSLGMPHAIPTSDPEQI